MKLLTVGDSFTYGEELADKQLAWPYLLGKRLGFEVTNLARPGAGNTRMVRHVTENYHNYDLIIIGWSHYARMEFADEQGYYDIWPGCRAAAHTQQAPWRSTIIDYVTKHHNDEYLFNQQMINVLLVQSLLKFNNKKYLMLDSFDDTTNRIQKLSNPRSSSVDRNYYLGWPDQTMMEWTYGVEQGPGGHFLDKGHKIISDILYIRMKELQWLS